MAEIKIPPCLRATIGVIKDGDYNLIGLKPNTQDLKITVAPKGDGSKLLTVNLSFELDYAEIIPQEKTYTEAEWKELEDRVCFWEFVKDSTTDIDNKNNPTLKFRETKIQNDTYHEVSVTFMMSNGKVGGGAGKVGGGAGKVGGGAGTLSGSNKDFRIE